MSTGLFTRLTPDATPHRRRRLLAIVAAAVLLLTVVVALLTHAESGPHFINLTVTNATDYDLSVAVAGTSGSSSTIGVVGRHATATFQQVADEGKVWAFDFAAQGQDGGGLTVPRSVLAASGWRVVVPPSVDAHLRAQGAPLPPR